MAANQDQAEDSPIHRSFYPSGKAEAEPQKYYTNDEVWLKQDATRGPMWVTVVDCEKNPGTDAWSYTLKDNQGTSVDEGKAFPQSDLYRAKKKK
ncbi:hypothetical protein Vi05172_g6943 [Venturia inaequalis]|nr:hypothetical protein Vi05172_g6943 [Venturia inaequalis]